MTANPSDSVKIIPSLLASNFAIIGTEVERAVNGGADAIHLDVMDGHFVPPITFGTQMLKAIKPYSGLLPIEVHLMVTDPLKYISEIVEAGADIILCHAETDSDLKATIREIQSYGVKAGIAIKPETGIDILKDIMDTVDVILVMTVEPGYGGQEYLRSVETKIKGVRKLIDLGDSDPELEVDGGITGSNIRSAYLAGARRFVAGSSIYGSKESVESQINLLRNSIDGL
jgi:ribulose-phosphate 3-epimerase